MRIPCPYCGERGNEEFTVRGAADPVRPTPDAPLADWVAHLHERENARGPHRELWQHVAGCRAWLVVERDTGSHAVLGVTPLRPAPIGGARGA